jgi:hypothetical protein
MIVVNVYDIIWGKIHPAPIARDIPLTSGLKTKFVLRRKAVVGGSFISVNLLRIIFLPSYRHMEILFSPHAPILPSSLKMRLALTHPNSRRRRAPFIVTF